LAYLIVAAAAKFGRKGKIENNIPSYSNWKIQKIQHF
jgi:hypothetical protein